MSTYPRMGAHKTVNSFREHLSSLGLELPCDDAPLSAVEGSPLAAPLPAGGLRIGNRWCVHPMEGWDGTADGLPTEHTRRRWQHFGESGCKLIWGGEAFAVSPEGRANPRQLYHHSQNPYSIKPLLDDLLTAHRSAFGAAATDDLLVGLQLTHSGRFCKPHRNDRWEPRIVYHHPLLDSKFKIDPADDAVVLTDGDIRRIIDQYIAAARTAHVLGFQFVDVKSCHGYLGHEFLSARTRPGPYGGDLQGRSRFLREIIAGIRAEVPQLEIGVRLSIFDSPPYHPDPNRGSGKKLGPGIPDGLLGGDFTPFGARTDDPLQLDLSEPIALIKQLQGELGVQLWNLTAGSPYYNPHIQRPAFYPPSDGYQPPEDPLVGCVRQIAATREIKRSVEGAMFVGTGYSYLQEYLPQVAQALVRENWVDSIGIGRLVLSDWRFPSKVLSGEDVRSEKKICRTFSDCTTAPRNGLVSGCYPLDPLYKESPEHDVLKKFKVK